MKIKKENLSFDSIIVRSLIEISIPVIIIITVLSVIFYKNTVDSVDTQILDSNYSELSSISDVYDKTFESLNYTVNFLSYTNEMRMFFSAENPYHANAFYNLNIEKIISDTKNQADYIHSVSVLVENNTGVYQTTTDHSEKIGISSFPWYKSLKSDEKSDGLYTYPCAVENNYPYIISFVRKSTINNNNNNNNKCFLALNVDLRELNNFILNENPERLYIVNDGKIIYNRYLKTFMTDFSMDEVLKNIGKTFDERSFFVNSDKGRYVVSVKKSHLYGWSYLLVNSTDSSIAERNSKKLIVYAFIFAFIMLGVFVTYKYIMSIFRPIHQIFDAIDGKEISEKVSFPLEIKNISDKIMTFANNNEELKKELDNRLEILKKYQVYSLQAQINPHFMFNVLNTIYMQSISDYKIDRKTSEMLLKISKYLRYVLDNESEMADIKTEIDYAKIYTDFLMDRYEELTCVNWNIEEDIYEYKILKLCLQPILENAVYHGISQNIGKNGVLDIDGKKEDDRIIFVVSDNGIGMSKEKLSEVRKTFSKRENLNSEHIGLNNIDNRIKLLYGKNHGIEIESEENVGTTVKIMLPII